MSGVKNFMRKFQSFKEPKRNSQKSASTSHLANKSKTTNNESEAAQEYDIPYCLRQLQKENNINNSGKYNNNNNNNNNRNNINSHINNSKELSKSHDHLRSRGPQGPPYINNLGNEQRNSEHYFTYRRARNRVDPEPTSVQYSLVGHRPRVLSSAHLAPGDVGHRADFTDVPRGTAGRNSSMSLQNLRRKDTSDYVRFSKVNSNTLQVDKKISRKELPWIFEDVFLRKTRQRQGWGFTVAGGRDAPGGVHIDPLRSVFVQRVVSGGLALADGRLRPRDIIVSVNGVEVQGSTHIHVVELLKNAGSQVYLRVKRTPLMEGKLIEVTLRKDSPSSKGGLGFSVSGGVGTPELPDNDAILVTQVFPDGVAGRDGRIAVGDLILFVDDVDMTGRTHNEAVDILRSSTQGKDFVTLQLLRKEGTTWPQHTLRPTSINAINNPPGGAGEVVYSKVMKRSTPPVNHEPGVHSPPGSTLYKPRRIVIRRDPSNRGLGLNIVGGAGGFGLFVNYVIRGSPCERTDLRKGDKLLRVNHIDLQDVSHEEAVTALMNSGDHVVIVVQHKPEELEMFEKWMSLQSPVSDGGRGGHDDDDHDHHHHHNGHRDDDGGVNEIPKHVLPSADDVFLRSLFDYDPFLDVTFSPFDPAPIERLRVKFGEVFRVPRRSLDDQWWHVTKVFSLDFNSKHANNNNNNMPEVGFIPGMKNRALSLQNDPSLVESKGGRNSAEFRTSKKRRSFIFSSKLKQKTLEKKFGSTLGFYEPVNLRQILHHRPLLILGPLKDRMNDLLISRYPHLFEGSVPHTTRPMKPGEISGREYVFVLTREEMEEQIKRGAFLEVGVYRSHYYGVSFESIRSIARQKKHCLLDVSIESIERLRSADIFPIVILLKSSSNSLISSWLQTTDESRLKNVKEQTDLLFVEHKSAFSAVVEGRTEEDLHRGVMAALEVHGRRYMWVPSVERGSS